MRQLNGIYTQAFNRSHHRVGHLFKGRFKAILAERECYLLELCLELCRYIVLNPVRVNAMDRAAAGNEAVTGLSRHEIATYLEVHYATVSRRLKRMEEQIV